MIKIMLLRLHIFIQRGIINNVLHLAPTGAKLIINNVLQLVSVQIQVQPGEPIKS
jgi:hypothetical protein